MRILEYASTAVPVEDRKGRIEGKRPGPSNH